jgi:hypothetical protein
VHRFQVAGHIVETRQDQNRQAQPDLHGVLHHRTPFKARASLTDNDEFESLGIQIADAFFIGTAASHAESLLLEHHKVELQTPGIVMNEKDSAFVTLPGSLCAVLVRNPLYH